MPRTVKKSQKSVIKRRERRIIGLFIDGINLDRATKRLQRKIALTSLVQSLSMGGELAVCRYYTVIPNEDDARQLAFLDAVSRAGLTVLLKRLPPIGSTRKVSTNLEMASDITAFALGCSKFCEEYVYRPADKRKEPSRPQSFVSSSRLSINPRILGNTDKSLEKGSTLPTDKDTLIKRIAIIVCPEQELAYPISLANELGVDTVTADFSNPRARNIMKSSAKWIDLSTSESIWRD
ncbi:MAG: NYN domain-containing protein [SAR324 cluster bacterium]|uniref:NYN domain-containing protein n=1 Tax=SAR324 cluster bacterium TaxID=2024889 RepID=A0A7X9FQ58_9DELT|nr:NYN domain-containing protein [SAR324 cluster bacterium]